ncbi:MAG TPA: GC-type dockerin domain-anchored protein, partial [Phycisphaerales bacterium]|nr:GC-type dockerin domain-anchored protein [Phycisphaerales bacterium]
NGAGTGGGGAWFYDCDEARVDDCLFTGNGTHPDSTIGEGAAIAFTGRTLDVQRSTFLLNLATGASIASGGAVFAADLFGGGLEARFRDCEFTANAALAPTATGGACTVATDSIVSFERCAFHLNQAAGAGSGSGGAIVAASQGGSGLLMVGACGFTSNSADSLGAAIYGNLDLALAGSLLAGNSGAAAVMNTSATALDDCTVAGNTHAGAGAAGIYALGMLHVENSVLHGNTNGSGGGQGAQLWAAGGATVDSSCVEGWDGSLGGAGSFDADPRFMDPDGADNIAGTVDDDYRLRGGSPCIDAGDNTALPADTHDLDDDGDTGERMPLDLDLNPRRLDDPGMDDTGNGAGALVDIGAYEFQSTTCVGDYDGNTIVDIRDVLAFLNAWNAGESAADIDGNGAVDTRDVIAFLNAWAAGC